MDLFKCNHCDQIYLNYHYYCLECDEKYCKFCLDEVFLPLLPNQNKINIKKESYSQCIYCTNEYEIREFKNDDILSILCEIYNKSIDELIEDCRSYLIKNK